MPEAQADRRRKRRVLSGHAVIDTAESTTPCRLLDVSLGGALLEATEPHDLDDGATIRLHLDLGDDRWFALEGRVRPRGADRLAVVFTQVPAELEHAIEATIVDGLDEAREVEDRSQRRAAVLDAAAPFAERLPTAPPVDVLALDREAPQAARDPAAAPRSVPCVLIVEDDDDLREMLVAVLRAAGYGADGAGDGRDALTLLRANPERYSAILLDYSMPQMDGHAFRRAQQCDPSIAGIPVILSSAVPPSERPPLDVDAEVVKPASTDDLLAAIQSCRLPN